MSDIYTRQEELLLGPPIALAPDEAACDVFGCDRPAANILPGAAVCREHSTKFGVGVGDGEYSIPLGELVGDERWREARYRQYEEMIQSLPPMQRSVRRDELLAGLAARHVDGLLQEE